MNIKENDIMIYEDKDGIIKVNVKFIDEDIWLTKYHIADIYKTTRQNIEQHINNIYADKELDIEATCKKFLQVQKEGNRSVKRNVDHYNLDMIVALGYRVQSEVAVRFRIWATKILKEYMIKGFALNDERLKNNGENPYFEELLARIRDIRSSEKVFWRKVLDIYATSIDYNPKDNLSIEFFKTVQNKMHYATHGNTTAEVIFNRVDANKENIGLTNFKGDIPTKQDTEIAKNYLTEEEINILNRMVSAYLDIAEINALSHNPMTMQDWIRELDSFLTMTRRDILTHSGTISHKQALEKAHKEYNKYMETHLTTAEKDYIEILNKSVNDLEK